MNIWDKYLPENKKDIWGKYANMPTAAQTLGDEVRQKMGIQTGSKSAAGLAASLAAQKSAAQVSNMSKYVQGEQTLKGRIDNSLDSKGLLTTKSVFRGVQSGTEIDTDYGRTAPEEEKPQFTMLKDGMTAQPIVEKKDVINSADNVTELQSAAQRAGIAQTDVYKEKLAAAQQGSNKIAEQYSQQKKTDSATMASKDIRTRAETISQLETEAESSKDFATTSEKGKADNKILFVDRQTAMGSWATISNRLKNVEMQYLTADEKKVYAYWLAKDKDTAEKYYDALSTARNYRRKTDENAVIQELSEKAPVLGVASNVVGSFLSPAALVGTAVHNVKDAVTGEETPIDPNSWYFTGAHMTDASSQGIKNATGNTALGNFLVDTGLSMTQFASKLPLGALALPLMASGAGGQTSLEVVQRGGTAKQALGMGIMSALAEYVTEKIPLDNLKRIYKNGGRGFKSAWQAAASNTLTQIGSEAGEEFTSEIMNNISDNLIMGDNSQMQNYIDELIAQGASEDEAIRQATLRFWVMNPLLAAAGGGLSGGVMGLAGSVAGNIRQGRIDAESGSQMRSLWGTDFDAAINEIITTGQEYSKNTAAGNYANKTKSAIDSGKGLSDRQAGQLYREVVNTQGKEAEAYFNGEMPKSPFRLYKDGSMMIPAQRLISEYDLKKQQYKYAQALVKNLNQFGVKNIVVEDMADGETGRWENGTVYVSSKLDTAQAINAKVAHEISHAAKEGDAAFSADITDVMRSIGIDVDAIIEQKVKTYSEFFAKRGKSEEWIRNTVTEEYAADEVAADYIGTLLKDDTQLSTIAKKPGLVRRILEAIERLITGKSQQEKNVYTQLANKLRKVAGVEKTTVSASEAGTRYDLENIITENVIQQEIHDVASMKPVANIDMRGFAKNEVDLITQVENYFDRIGNKATNSLLGPVLLDRRGVKSDVGHGIGRKKAASFAAVPEVIEQGKIIDYQRNWKGRHYDSAVIAAPVVIEDDPYLLGIVVTRNDGENRFYLHEVYIEREGNLSFKTGTNQTASVPGDKLPSLYRLLQKVSEVKKNSSTETIDAEFTTDGGITKDNNLGQEVTPSINSASTNNIRENAEKINNNFSDEETRYSVEDETGEYMETLVNEEEKREEQRLAKLRKKAEYTETVSNDTLKSSVDYLDIILEEAEREEQEAQAKKELRRQQADEKAAQVIQKSIKKALNINHFNGSPSELDVVKEIYASPDASLYPKVDESDYVWANGMTGRGVAYAKDLSRNLDAAAGDNAELRDLLKNKFERPMWKAQDSRAREVRKRLNDLKAKMDELGIKAGSEESAAVQRYGEGQMQDEYGELHEYTIEHLKENFPDSWQNIIEAEKYCREVYGEYIGRINNVLEQIYPDVNERAGKEVTKYAAMAEFYRSQASEQKKAIISIEQKLSDRRAKLNGTKSEKRAADLTNSINYWDRLLGKAREKAEKYESLEARAKSLAATKQNEIESGEILHNKRLIPRKDYFHHFTEVERGFEGLVNIVSTPADIDARLAGPSEYTKPKTKWAGFLQHRGQGRYIEDAVGGLLKYIPAAEYKIAYDPIIAQGRQDIKGIAGATEESRVANKFLEWYGDYINDLAGKTNPIFDRGIQKLTSRKFLASLRWLNSRVKSNAIMGSVRSAISQFFNLPNAFAYVKSPKAWLGGMKLCWEQMLKRPTAVAAMEQSGFMSERYLDSAITQFNEGIVKAPERFANWLMTFGDQQVTKLIWSAAYSEALDKKVSNPVEYADDITRRAVAGRGVGEVPLTQKSQFIQLIAPFQVEVNNTWNILKEKVGEKDALGLLLMFIASYIMNGITRELFGIDVSYDPINSVVDGVQDWSDEDNVFNNVSNIVMRIGGETLSTMPMGTQIADYAVPDDADREKLFGESDPTRFGTGNIGLNMMLKPIISYYSGNDVINDLISSILNIGLPMGGKQLERIFNGMQDMDIIPTYTFTKENGFEYHPQEGGASITANGTLRFPIQRDPLNVAADLLLSPYSTREGKKYIKDGDKPLNENQTAVYNQLVKNKCPGKTAYNIVTELQDAEAHTTGHNNAVVQTKAEVQRAILNKADLTPREKDVVYYGMLATEEERAVMDKLDDMKVKYGESYAVLSAFKNVVSTDDSTAVSQKREILLKSGLTSEQKQTVYTDLLLAGKDDETKSLYENMLQQCADAGIDFNTVLEAGKAFEGSGSKARVEKFISMTGAGVSQKSAIKVVKAISELAPAAGADDISNLQKLQAIASSDVSEKEKLVAAGQFVKTMAAKLTQANLYSVTVGQYVAFSNKLPQYDADGNGSYKQAEVTAALDNMKGLSTNQKAALWQIQTRGKNNPFNQSIGTKIETALDTASEQKTTETSGNMWSKYMNEDTASNTAEDNTTANSTNIWDKYMS